MLIKSVKLFAFLLVFTLSGCSFTKYTEPENRIYATALGIDKTTSGYILTCETTNSEASSLLAGELFTAEGNSLTSAFYELKTAMHKTPCFFKCPVIFVGESITKSGVYEIVSFLLKQNEFSFSVRLACAQNANHLLNSKTKFNLPKGVLAYETIKKNEKGDSLAIILNKNTFSLPIFTETNGALKINATKDFYE